MHLDLTAEEAALFFGCCAALSTMTAFGYRRVSTVRGARAISLRHNKNQAPAASNDVRITRAAIRPRRSTIPASVGRRLIVCRRRQGPKKPNWHPSRHSPSERAHCGFWLTTDDLVKSSDQSRNAYTAQVVAGHVTQPRPWRLHSLGRSRRPKLARSAG